MENEEPSALMQHLGEIQAAIDFLQGTQEAQHVAMSALLSSVDPASPVAAQVRARMQEWRALIGHADSQTQPAHLAGFDSTHKALLQELTPKGSAKAH